MFNQSAVLVVFYPIVSVLVIFLGCRTYINWILALQACLLFPSDILWKWRDRIMLLFLTSFLLVLNSLAVVCMQVIAVREALATGDKTRRQARGGMEVEWKSTPHGIKQYLFMQWQIMKLLSASEALRQNTNHIRTFLSTSSKNKQLAGHGLSLCTL